MDRRQLDQRVRDIRGWAFAGRLFWLTYCKVSLNIKKSRLLGVVSPKARYPDIGYLVPTGVSGINPCLKFSIPLSFTRIHAFLVFPNIGCSFSLPTIGAWCRQGAESTS